MQLQQRPSAFLRQRQALAEAHAPSVTIMAGDSCCCGLQLACPALHGASIAPRAHEFRRARQGIYRSGEPCEDIITICSGWAFRYKQLRSGKRQILSLLLPGDIVSASALFHQPMDFSIEALTNVRYGRISRAEMRERFPGPAFLDLVSRLLIAERRDADDQLVDLGQRLAEGRIAALILRLRERFLARDGAAAAGFPFPLRQQHIADIAGLTLVHVSRIIGSLRKSGIIEISAGRIVLHNLAELQRIGDMR